MAAAPRLAFARFFHGLGERAGRLTPENVLDFGKKRTTSCLYKYDSVNRK